MAFKMMLAALMIAVGVQMAASSTVVCKCTKERLPVCGVDGTTYDNKCLLDCHGVDLNYEGECGSNVVKREVPCECPYTYEPVCGTNGQTYANDCERNCSQVPLARSGICETETVEPNHLGKREVACPCPNVLLPVCGTDGKTYNNDCERVCVGVDLDHTGECGSTVLSKREVACPCPRLLLPVCGTDGNTYLNDCERVCAGVELAHDGECGSAVLVKREVPCECPYTYEPVCGTNGQTYANDCERSCNEVPLARSGVCETETVEPNHLGKREVACPCPRVLLPVCGTDGNTYLNDCERVCVGVDLAHEGECGSTVVVKREVPCTCPYTYEPVCGTNGQTYANDCERNCNEVPLARSGVCETETVEPNHLGKREVTCPCPRVLLPVCGTDGKTYLNDCERVCVGVDLAHEGECGSTVVVKREVPCECPYTYEPVCGTNGQTYANDCERNCNEVPLARSGVCETETVEPNHLGKREVACPCRRVLLPVCGSDGNTYPNECERVCAGVDLAYDGACTSA